ncbi:extracellular solute-binding protein [Paenibacillus senegalensis]|uniref:extracellular solute-binding protein n=1 Tax=Paenibacillus senegalensis TaxID=1465766 RepID=UPI000288C6E2|nr:extracellular solute-binding protein [Paenibacillus senegalensis]
MYAKRKSLHALLALLLSLALLAACSSNKGPVSEGGGTENGVDDGIPEERKTLSMFMINSGLAHPDNVDPSDNPFINIIEEEANVDLRLDVPAYSDWETVFRLMLASGKLPDIVHSPGLHSEIYQAANEGAFIDLKEYYDNSPIVQAVISPEMMELAKDMDSGHYWRIPMNYESSPPGSGLFTRYDLVEKYNDGIWPRSVDEWVDLMRKIKADDESALILTTRPVGDQLFHYGGRVIYDMYGADPYGWRVMDGEIIPNVLLPEYRAATQKMRELYAEGLLDPEFATNDSAIYFQKLQNQGILMQWNTADQLPNFARQYLVSPDYADQRHYKWVFAPPLEEYPAELADPKYAAGPKGSPITGHGLYISAAASDPDRAWRVIEAFASERLYEAIFWGEEGETYTVVNGERVPDADALASQDRRWTLHLALLWGFQNGQEVQRAINEQVLGEDYAKLVYDSLDVLQEKAEERGLHQLIGYNASGEAAMKGSESMQAINRFTVEAITGRISMEQFDAEVQKWEQTYRSIIYDPMQRYMDENKDFLRSVGFKAVDW